MSHQYATGSGGMYNDQALQDADGDRAWLMGVVHEWTGRPVMCERGNVTFYVRLLDGTVPPAFTTTFETEMVEARAANR